MKIDSLFHGVKVNAVSPRRLYKDGAPTDIQDSLDGVPLWSVEVALPDGAYVLPVRVRVPSATEPKVGLNCRFAGIAVSTFNGKLFYSAEKIEPIDGLSNLFEEE